MKNIAFSFLLLIFSIISSAQSDIENVLKAGTLVLNGLSILRVSKAVVAENNNSINSVCIKNKLAEKISVNVYGKSFEGDDLKKQLVIQKESKECFLELPKGIYTYEVFLSNNEICKKGEYKFDENIVMTIKKDE